MSNVVDISTVKPHWSGEAICTSCGHEWVAVVPMSADSECIECPSCSKFNGAPKAPFIPETYFQCGCGSGLFYIKPNGLQCRRCGEEPDL